MATEHGAVPSPRDFGSDIDRLSEYVSTAQQRAFLPIYPDRAAMAEAMEELTCALEELRAANEELVAARQATDSEQRRYRELFDLAPDGYLVTDIHGVIQEANRAAVALLNVPWNYLPGKPLVVFIAADSRQAFLTQLARLQQGEELHEWEVRLQPRSGLPVPVVFSCVPARGVQEQVVGLRWLVRDISERKRAEEALRRAHDTLEQRVQERTAELTGANAALRAEIAERRRVETALKESEERLRFALSAAQVGIWDWDMATGALTWSEQLEPMHGFAPGSFGGTFQAFLDLVHPDDRPYLEQAIARAVEERTHFDAEFRVIWPDGSVHWMAGKGRVLYDEAGRAVRMLGIGMEITARREMEAQLRAALREKELLLKEVHHRVKNNLQVVSSLLDLQADASDDPRIRTLFEESQHRIHAISLIHETLYQSGDGGKIELSSLIRLLAERLLRAYVRDAEAMRLQIDAEEVWLDLQRGVPCGLILNELLSNCFKHAFPAGHAGLIHIVLQGNSGQQVCLSIKDSGVGFPADVDFRNTNSLGLQLVCMLAEQLQAEIELEHHAGTTFTLTFPL
jgi:PAS domain S-box-containing protein